MKKTIIFPILAFFMVLTSSYAQQTNQNITFGGDFRLRHDTEQLENSSGNFDLRTRERLRMRLSVIAKLSGELEAFFRIASGEGSPVSTNQTFTSGFS